MVSRMEKRFSYYFSLSLRFKAQAFFAWENNGCVCSNSMVGIPGAR